MELDDVEDAATDGDMMTEEANEGMQDNEDEEMEKQANKSMQKGSQKKKLKRSPLSDPPQTKKRRVGHDEDDDWLPPHNSYDEDDDRKERRHGKKMKKIEAWKVMYDDHIMEKVNTKQKVLNKNETQKAVEKCPTLMQMTNNTSTWLKIKQKMNAQVQKIKRNKEKAVKKSSVASE